MRSPTGGRIVETAGASLRRHRMVLPGQTVAVACSGGPDSTALLLALHELAPSLEITIAVCCFDHGYRAASADECAAVERMARRLALPFASERNHRPAPAAGIPAEARRLRYRFFERLVAQGFCQMIATGHTRDDQVETILFQSLRGGRPEGWGGIPPVRGPFIRPLLDVTKSELVRWLEGQGIPFVHDPTNADRRYRRARLRHTLIPRLGELIPGGAGGVLRLGSAMSRMAAAVERECDRRWEALVINAAPGRIVLDPALLAALPGPVARIALERAAARVGGTSRHLPEERVAAIGQLVTEGPLGRSLDLGGGIALRRDHGGLTVSRAAGAEEREIPFAPGLSLPFGGGLVTIGAGTGAGAIDPARLNGAGMIRTRRGGDYLRLPGGRRSLKRYLIDRKVPASLRDRIPLLAVGGEIAAVAGIVAAPAYRPSGAGTGVILFWRYPA